MHIACNIGPICIQLISIQSIIQALYAYNKGCRKRKLFCTRSWFHIEWTGFDCAESYHTANRWFLYNIDMYQVVQAFSSISIGNARYNLYQVIHRQNKLALADFRRLLRRLEAEHDDEYGQIIMIYPSFLIVKDIRFQLLQPLMSQLMDSEGLGV